MAVLLNCCICGYQGKIDRLEADRDRWVAMADRMYDIMLAHETVEHDVWNEAIDDCWKMYMAWRNED